MGKYLTSLLILASSVLLPDEIFADEQVRRVQEELRRRHLFFANGDGEPSRALTAAVRRYQQKKGFAATGVIDSDTLASLGIVAAPSAASTPFAVGHRGEIRGANGEKLPNYPLFLWHENERLSQFDPALVGPHQIELDLAKRDRPGQRRDRTAAERVGLITHEDETAGPFQIRLEMSDKAIGETVGDSAGTRLVLHQPSAMSLDLDAMHEERGEETAMKSRSPSQSRTRKVRPRQETNPIILTYRTIDRAVRLFFGDAPTKRKRATAKRL